MHFRCSVLAVLLAVSVIGSTAISRAQGNNPGIIPPQAKYHGLSYADWEAKWWQAAFAIPIIGGDHPLFSGGVFGDEKGVKFLSGVGGGPTIPITIPSGTALFFPIINFECSNVEGPPFFGATEADRRACANFLTDQVSGLAAEIDGRSVQELSRYRTESPGFAFNFPTDNILFIPGPGSALSVDAGYYLLLTPMSVGAHTIHFTATTDYFGFTFDTTYVVTVAPGK